MAIRDKISVDFDADRRIASFSTSERLHFSTSEQLQELYQATSAILDEIAGEEPCYVMVDLAKFVIEPALFGDYARLSAKIKEKYLYPDGMVGYGFEITRITVKLSYSGSFERPKLFSTRAEAEKYLESLISQRLQKTNAC